jgi:hypothetical protein
MSWVKFLQDLSKEQLIKVEQGFIARIVSFNKENMRAEITPLLEYTSDISGESKTTQATNIPNVPCEILYAGGYYIRPVYVKDDLVNCQLKSSNITKPIDSGVRADSLDNRFSLSYCTVSGAVIPENFKAPDAWKDKAGLLIGFGDDFVIEVLNGTIKIENVNGNIELTENGTVTINDNFEVIV